jgi:hypothetical protein
MPARDSYLWNVLLTVGLAMAGALIVGDAADYGVSATTFKWLQLLATGIVAVGGKMGNSKAPEPDGK